MDKRVNQSGQSGMKKVKLIIIFALCLVFIVAGVLLLQLKSENERHKYDDMPLKVTFLNVGKADCILIQMEELNIMIDTGYDENGEQICDYLDDNNITKLDYLILTHSDKDHIGGADIVLEHVETDMVIQSLNRVDTREYEEYQQVIKRQEIASLELEEIFYIKGKNMELVIYPTDQKKYDKDNDYSLAAKLNFGDCGLFFAGDAEEERIDELLTLDDEILLSNLLKIPHHGREADNSTLLIDKVAPEYSIITCEDKSMAADAVLDELYAIQSKILYTCDGNIYVYSDGTGLIVSQEKP